MERDALFDLAINRSLAYVKTLGVNTSDEDELKKGLEVWYLKTRFAYRISLADIVEVLRKYPGSGEWSGGKDGIWQDSNNS